MVCYISANKSFRFCSILLMLYFFPILSELSMALLSSIFSNAFQDTDAVIHVHCLKTVEESAILDIDDSVTDVCDDKDIVSFSAIPFICFFQFLILVGQTWYGILTSISFVTFLFHCQNYCTPRLLCLPHIKK